LPLEKWGTALAIGATLVVVGALTDGAGDIPILAGLEAGAGAEGAAGAAGEAGATIPIGKGCSELVKQAIRHRIFGMRMGASGVTMTWITIIQLPIGTIILGPVGTQSGKIYFPSRISSLMADTFEIWKLCSEKMPQLLFNIRQLPELNRLRDTFSDLAMNNTDETIILNSRWERPGEVYGLILRTTELSGQSKCLFRHKDIDKETFLWICSDEGWLDCQDLVEEMVRLGKPGHQYLTSPTCDDAEIVISYMEQADHI
jgi:hypothetical protein